MSRPTKAEMQVANELIREQYPKGDLVELAEACKCTVGAVCQRAGRLKVRREVIASRSPHVELERHPNPMVTFIKPWHMVHKAT